MGSSFDPRSPRRTNPTIDLPSQVERVTGLPPCWWQRAEALAALWSGCRRFG